MRRNRFWLRDSGLLRGRRKKLSQTPGLEERRKAAPDRADPERAVAYGIREWG